MNTQRINITLPKTLIQQLNLHIPERGRSKFIAEAVESKMNDKKKHLTALAASLKANYNYYKKESKVWEVTNQDGIEKWEENSNPIQ